MPEKLMALLLWLLQCGDIKREWNADKAEGKSGKRNSWTKERVVNVERGRMRWEASHWVCGSCPRRKKERLKWGQCQMHGDTCRDQHASRFNCKMSWWACSHIIWVCVYQSLPHTNTDVNMSTHLSVIVSLSPLATPFITVLAFGVRTTWETKKVPFLLHETQFHFVLFFYVEQLLTLAPVIDWVTFELCLHRTKNTYIVTKTPHAYLCEKHIFPLLSAVSFKCMYEWVYEVKMLFFIMSYK